MLNDTSYFKKMTQEWKYHQLFIYLKVGFVIKNFSQRRFQSQMDLLTVDFHENLEKK